MRPRRLVALVAPFAAGLTISCAPGTEGTAPVTAPGTAAAAAAPVTVTVNGRVLPLDGVPTVGAALVKTSTSVPSGRLLSVVHRKRLGSDRAPGTVLLNGSPSSVAAPLHGGDAVVTVAGLDAVEPTRTAIEQFQPLTAAGLYVGGHPGTARVVRGSVSHEVLSRKVLTRPVLGHLPSPGAVALTFDDGPNPAWTPRVLALLAHAHVHATFCLIGRQAAQYPALVRAVAKGGHTLCNHTWSHDEKLPGRTPAQIRTEMTRTQEAIGRASGGVVPRLFRAPGGAWSPGVEAMARSLHMTPLRWTVDPRDWSRPGTDAILGITLARLRPGGVLLLHDGGGDRGETLAALSRLLTLLPKLGYSFTVPRP